MAAQIPIVHCVSFTQTKSVSSRFAVRDMRQTVAVGVIKATTPKAVEGSKTKAAEKAMKKK